MLREFNYRLESLKVIEKFGILMGMKVVSFYTPLIKKEKNSDDAWNFHFERPLGFTYQAGQYIKMKLDIENPDDRGVTRYFTLSSSPTDDFLMVTTRILKSTFKMKLGELKVGDTVHMRGPWGDFVLSEDDKPRVFIAGGIGMTPFHSMLRYVGESNINVPILLFVSYKTPGQILYRNELEKITRKHKNIQIITTITKPEGTRWIGATGRINTELLRKHIANLHENIYYVAGPDPMVEEMEKLLEGTGIKKEQILTDGFPGY